MDKVYDRKVKKASPDSPLLSNCLKAFVVGGGICLIGEICFYFFSRWGAAEKEASACVSVLLISITAALTGIGIFDKITKFAGAGAFVPITGFANGMTAPAVEYGTEGRVLGTAVKMFSIVGPVIVYGTAAAALYGAICYFFLR